MKVLNLNCASCGGSLTVESRFTMTVTCPYCNTVSVLENDKLNVIGVSKPFEALTLFKVGLTCDYQGRTLKVLGRIRLQDDEDVWDEWYVALDDIPHWIEESSDSISLLSSLKPTKPIPGFDEIRVGAVLNLDNQDVFICERGKATVMGVEGQFTGRVKPNDAYSFIQGNSEEGLYMVEYYNDEIKAYKGCLLDTNDITLPS